MVVGVVIALVLTHFRFEGGIALWIALIVAGLAEADSGGYASFAKPSVLTGSKDERKAIHYQAVKHMLSMLYWPVDLWDDGFPETALAITALAGILIGFLPLRAMVINQYTVQLLWLHIANGVFGALGAHAIYAFTRKKVETPLPLTTVQGRLSAVAKKEPVALIMTIGLSFIAGFVVSIFYAKWVGVAGIQAILIDVSGGVIVALSVLVLWSSSEDRKKAKETAQIEGQWFSTWTQVGIKTLPSFITHKEVADGITLDYFRVPAGETILTFASPRTASLLTADDSYVFVTQARQLGEDMSEPRYLGPSSLSVNTFRVCTWRKDVAPTFSGEADLDIYSLWIECMFSSSLREAGVSAPHLTDIEVVSEDESECLVFHVFFGWPDGPDGSLDLAPYLGSVPAAMGQPCLADAARQPGDPDVAQYFGTTERYYVGNYEEAEMPEEVVEKIRIILESQTWDAGWQAADLHDSPTWFAEYDKSEKLIMTDGDYAGDVEISTFGLAQGQTYNDLVVGKGRRTERLKTAMQINTVSIIKHISGQTATDQHVDVLCVRENVPLNLSVYAASSRKAVMMLANCILDSLSVQYKIEGAWVSEARVVSTPADSDDISNRDVEEGNIWRIQVRVPGISAFTTFQRQAEDIRRVLSAKWVRMEWNTPVRSGQSNDSFYMYIGPSRDVAEEYYDDTTIELMNRLDLQAAWSVAHVQNTNGDVPTLIESRRLSDHTEVEQYRFALPEGVTPEKVSGAVSSLKAASGFGFLQVLPNGDDPSAVEILASHKDPLQALEVYDPTIATGKPGLSLGKGIDGESVSFDTATTPHLLVNGPTGTGKSQPLDEMIPVPVCDKFPTGVASIAQIAAGDLVFDAEGNPTTVLGLSPITWHHESVVEFDNGVKVRCSPDHLWRVQRPRPEGGLASAVVASGLRNLLMSTSKRPKDDESKELIASMSDASVMLEAVLTTAQLRTLVGEEIYVTMPAMVANENPLINPQLLIDSILSGNEPWQHAYGLPLVDRHDLLVALLARDGKTDATCAIASTLGRSLVKDDSNQWVDACVSPRRVRLADVIMSGEPIPMRCLIVDNPRHLYLAAGGVPTHNSILQSNIILAALGRGDDVYVIDPVKHMADFKVFMPYLAGYAGESVIEAAGLIAIINEEFTRRKAINAKYGASNGRSSEIPEEERYPAMLVILDEATSLLMLDKQKGSETSSFDTDEANYRVLREAEERSKAVIGSTVSNIAREARAALVSLVLGMQKLDSKILDALPLHKDAKENAGRILLGVSSQAVRQSVLRQPDKSPKVEAPPGKENMVGRGVYEPITGAGRLFQGWYFDDGQMASTLKSLDLYEYTDRPDPMAHLAPDILAIMGDIDDDSDPVIADTEEVSVDDDDFLALLGGGSTTEVVEDPIDTFIEDDTERTDEEEDRSLDVETDDEDEEDETESTDIVEAIDSEEEETLVDDSEVLPIDIRSTQKFEAPKEDPWEARRKRKAAEAKRNGSRTALNALTALPQQNEE
jgi:hypothetical protein